MLSEIQPHFWYPRRDSTVLVTLDVILFLCVHWFSNFGVWSHDWKDPVNSLWLHSQVSMILFDIVTRFRYKQICGDQINLPESLAFLLQALHGFRFYTVLVMVNMGLVRLNTDEYSGTLQQQAWWSIGLFLFVVTRVLYDWGAFDCCRRGDALRPLPLDCDPRTRAVNVSVSHDGLIKAVKDPSSSLTHVSTLDANTGGMSHSIVNPCHPTRHYQYVRLYLLFRPSSSSHARSVRRRKAVHQSECAKCLDHRNARTDRLCTHHIAEAVTLGTLQQGKKEA